MKDVTAGYFSQEFIMKNKLNLSSIIILDFIYKWIFSHNPPNSKLNNKRLFYISQTYISNNFKGLIDRSSISRAIQKLKKCGIIDNTIIELKTGKHYISFNWNIILKSLVINAVPNKSWIKNIFDFIQEEKQDKYLTYKNTSYNKKIKEKKMGEFLSDRDLGIKYSKNSDLIARKILKQYSHYFSTRFPKSNESPTKTYINLCNKITDIYNNNFLNPRFYNFDKGVFNNKQFNTNGWQDKIAAVKDDWKKTEELIFQALDNFVLMHHQDRIPMNKKYLTNNLSEWIFSDNLKNRGQSQFIQSLNEPMIIKEKLTYNKAVGIVEELKNESPLSYYCGHELNKLLPLKANEVIAWTSIKKMIKWGQLLYRFDNNARYFLECEIDGRLEYGGEVLPLLFAKYLKNNKINVSLNTLDIKKSIDNNAPFRWFISEAIKKHHINPDCIYCIDKDDFYDVYENNSYYEDLVF